ncbi:hypothetical protein TCE0_017r04302 [Talaromyces pinophilus]|uniref:Uncharacterized protein n=1 Tax=Talaromyces pinophilus TaxID=128442 RepID=A0A6V8H466_TALPI|nr:hypothetical protein TCE0_017r04302 [Talaromyces pinophilus]
MPRRQLEQVFMPEESIRNDPKRSAEEMVLDIWKHCSLYARDSLSDDIRPTLFSCRAASAARQSHEHHPEVLSDGDLTLLETAMVHYAEYLNSTGIYTVDPFNLEDIEILRTSSILRFAAARQTQPQAANPPTTSKPTPTTRRIDPYIDVAFGSSQTSPTPRPYRNHRRGQSQSN